MPLVTIGSLHGAPGATTLAVGMCAAWNPDRGATLLVEADPDGGVLAARHESLRADRTVADLVVASRRSLTPDAIEAVSRTLWGGFAVVVAPPSAEQVHAAIATGGERLAGGLAGLAGTVTVVDVGRITAREVTVPLLRRSDLVVLVARPRFEDVALLTSRVRELRAVGVTPMLVCVGTDPYPPAEVATAADLELLGVVPDEPTQARFLSGGTGSDRRLRRSLLWRSLGELAVGVADQVTPRPRPGVVPPSPAGPQPETLPEPGTAPVPLLEAPADATPQASTVGEESP